MSPWKQPDKLDGMPGMRLTRLGTLMMKRILRWSFVGVHVHVGVALLSILSTFEAGAIAVGEASS